MESGIKKIFKEIKGFYNIKKGNRYNLSMDTKHNFFLYFTNELSKKHNLNNSLIPIFYMEAKNNNDFELDNLELYISQFEEDLWYGYIFITPKRSGYFSTPSQIKDDFVFHGNYIKNNPFFKNVKIFNHKISPLESTYTFLFTFEGFNINLYFLEFKETLASIMKKENKNEIKSEQNLLCLYNIVKNSYKKNGLLLIEDLIPFLDVRLGELTKESLELIEINFKL